MVDGEVEMKSDLQVICAAWNEVERSEQKWLRYCCFAHLWCHIINMHRGGGGERTRKTSVCICLNPNSRTQFISLVHNLIRGHFQRDKQLCDIFLSTPHSRSKIRSESTEEHAHHLIAALTLNEAADRVFHPWEYEIICRPQWTLVASLNVLFSKEDFFAPEALSLRRYRESGRIFADHENQPANCKYTQVRGALFGPIHSQFSPMLNCQHKIHPKQHWRFCFTCWCWRLHWIWLSCHLSLPAKCLSIWIILVPCKLFWRKHQDLNCEHTWLMSSQIIFIWVHFYLSVRPTGTRKTTVSDLPNQSQESGEIKNPLGVLEEQYVNFSSSTNRVPRSTICYPW